MPYKVKVPTINKKTKVGQLLNNPILKSSPLTNINFNERKKKYGFKTSDPFIDIMFDEFSGNEKYIISGKVRLDVIFEGGSKKTITRNYSFVIEAKKDLTTFNLESIIIAKLMDYFEGIPRFGFSEIRVKGLSFNSLQIPDDFKFHHRVRMFEQNYLELKLFNTKLNNEKQDIDQNCVIDYLYTELSKFYSKKATRRRITDGLNVYCKDVIKYGCSVNNFKLFMKDNFPNVHYTILSPDFNVLMYSRANDVSRKKLVFYVNNSHIYPITNLDIQKTINLKYAAGGNIQKYFGELQEHEFYNDFIYMDKQLSSLDDFQEECKTYIINKDDDIFNVCEYLISETGFAVEYVDINQKTGKLTMFKHPTKEIMICDYDDYHGRKQTMDKLNKLTNGNMPEFTNQSYSQIAKSLMGIIDHIPQSYYNKSSDYYLRNFEPKPIVQTLKDCKKEDLFMMDISKHYSSIMYNWYNKKGVYIPLYDIHHQVEEFKGGKIEYGEYFICEKEINGIKFGNCFLHYYVICELLENGYINDSDIKYCIKTKKRFKPNCFKKFIDITKKLDSSQFKTLNNLLNGSMKNHTKRSGKSYFTNDVNSLCFLINEAEKNNKKYFWKTSDNADYHFLKMYSEKKNYYNTSSFYRSCLSFALLDTLNLIKKCSKYGEVVKVKTDAVYYIPHNEIAPEDSKHNSYFENIGKAFHDIVDCDIFSRNPKIKEFEKYDLVIKDKCLFGSGGSGKSYKAVQDSDPNKKILFLSTSNNAVIEIKQKAYQLKDNIDNWTFSTIEMFMIDTKYIYQLAIEYLNGYDQIVLEEFSMCPIKFLRIIVNCDKPVLYIGDVCQLPPIIPANSGIESFDMSEFLSSFSYVENKAYNPKYARYTTQTYNLLENFRKTGYTNELIKKLKPVDDEKVYPFYLVDNNKDKDKYNKLCCDTFNKNGKEFIFRLTQSGKEKESKKGKAYKYMLDKNSPIICLKNDKELKSKGIANNWKGKLYKYNDKNVFIKGSMFIDGEFIKNSILKLSIDEFQSNFHPLYSSTVHKYQGGKIETDFAIIIKSKQRNRNMLYTALSRCVDYKNIHISKNIPKRYYWTDHDYLNQQMNFNIKHGLKIYYIYKQGDRYIAFDSDPKDAKCIFVKKVKSNDLCIGNIVSNLTKEYRTKKKQKKEIKQIYKNILPKSKDKIVITKDKVTFIYYEDEERKKKEMRHVKKGLDQTMQDMQKFIETKKSNPEIVNKTNNKMVLSFA